MTTLNEMKDRLVGAARVQGDQYAGGEERPLRGYLVTMTAYAGLVGGLAAAAKATGLARRQAPAPVGEPGHQGASDEGLATADR